MLAVSQGFISLVKSRERSFTLDHLQAIADALGLPLGAMLLEATKPDRPDPKTAELFEATERLIRKADQASEIIRQNLRAKSKSA